MPQPGVLTSIWVKRARRGPMDPVPRVAVRAGAGIVGNADQGGRRQVTIMDQDTWNRVSQDAGGDVAPVTRRANLLVAGLSLAESRGRTLRIGECRIRIFGETRPCNQMEEARPGLQKAMAGPWRGGAFGEILDDGTIALGMPVQWESGSA